MEIQKGTALSQIKPANVLYDLHQKIVSYILIFI